MKTAFNLVPDIENPVSLHLVAEIGWYGVSFAWYKKEPLSLEGVLCYNFNERIDATELATHLQYILDREPVFSQHPVSISVFYNFKESLLVPAKYFNDAHSPKQLAAIFGETYNRLLRTDQMESDKIMSAPEAIHNIYQVPQEVHSVVLNNFPGSRILHSTSMQANEAGEAELNCIVFHNTIKVILFNHGRLSFVQQFQYKAPEDVVYHLLNVCDKYDCSPAEITLMLSGMIDVESNLYQEIYKYFLNIVFRDISDEVFVSSRIKSFPSHFFSHLIFLAKCVS